MHTVLALVMKYLACHHIGSAKEIKQLNTDETSRRRISITNVVFGLLTEDEELRNICLTGLLISPDGTTDHQSESIIGAFGEAKRNVKLWREETQRMYPNELELLDELPTEEDLDPTRMLGGTISHDTCNSAQKTGRLLAEALKQLGREKGFSEEQLVVYQGNCWNHIRNIWLGAIDNYLARQLEEHMKNDLELIPFHMRVS